MTTRTMNAAASGVFPRSFGAMALVSAMALVGAMATLAASLPAQATGESRSGDVGVRGTGMVAGVVVDGTTGLRIAGAEVRLAGPDTTVLHANARGAWTSAAMRPGRYAVRVRRMGYVTGVAATDVGTGGAAPLVLRLDPVALALDQVVVTAARREQRLADAVQTTEVVTRADLERTGASNLASVLTEQTGVELQGGHPAGEGLMLQGIGAERVLVLLDGQPMAGRISGVFDVSRIPTAVVERVEIVKGPQSTLYGSEAMGGVVNIITRTPASGALGASFAATGGTQARRDGTAGITLGRGAFASQWDVAHRSIATAPGRRSPAAALAARTDAAAKVRWAPAGGRVIEASVLALDERQRWRAGTLNEFGDNQQWSGRLTGAWLHGRHRVTPTLYASVFDHVSRASEARRPIVGDTGQRQVQRVYQGELVYNTRLGRDATGAHALDAGLQIRRDETETARVTGGRRSTVVVEPFAQLDLAASTRLAVVPGVRVSRSSQWGTHVNPRVATRWRATDHLTIRASVSDGFRAPDFKELFLFFQNTNAGYAVYGNPALRPETSRNATVGAEWTGDAGFVRGQLFRNDFRGFIETRPTSAPGEPPLYRYFNVDNGSTRGIELETGIVRFGWRVEGGYGGLATRDRATGQPLLGRPSHSGRLVLGRTLPGALRTSVSLIVTGRTPMQRGDSSGAVVSWRDAYRRVDARIARTIPRGLEFVLGADNLVDTRPAEWAGFTGRHLYATLNWTFNRIGTP